MSNCYANETNDPPLRNLNPLRPTSTVGLDKSLVGGFVSDSFDYFLRSFFKGKDMTPKERKGKDMTPKERAEKFVKDNSYWSIQDSTDWQEMIPLLTKLIEDAIRERK